MMIFMAEYSCISDAYQTALAAGGRSCLRRSLSLLADQKFRSTSCRQTAVTMPPTTTTQSIDQAVDAVGMSPFQHGILCAAGLCFMADSMEVLLLSFLALVLQQEWGLTEHETAFITSSVFVGALMGTLTLGPLGDRIGRRPVMIATATLILVFGLLTALATTLPTLVLCRFLVGFGVGGLTVPFDTLAECVPTSQRGTQLLAIEYFWTLGTLLVPVAAYFTLPHWRLFVLACAIPCLLSLLLCLCWVPESPRWLLAKGRPDEALEILHTAAQVNGTHLPHETLLLSEPVVQEAALLQHPHRRTTLILWATWAGLAFTYYGTILLVTLVFADGSDESIFDYGAILTSASAELAGTTLALFTMDRWGRVRLQTSAYLLGGVSVLGLCCSSSRWVRIVWAFLGRLAFMCGSCTTWISTAEVLTTDVRTTGHAAANAVARLGGALSPYLVTQATPMVGFILCGVSWMTAWAAAHLPETSGKSMGTAAATVPDDITMQPPSYGGLL